MALTTVTDYLTRVRGLLQDTTSPYRYADTDLVDALNAAVTESKRIRPDMWFSYTTLPSYSATNEGATVAVDQMYGHAFCLFMVGMMQLRDQEDTQDPRAMAFLEQFQKALT